jgi:hypothetical protein
MPMLNAHGQVLCRDLRSVLDFWGRERGGGGGKKKRRRSPPFIYSYSIVVERRSSGVLLYLYIVYVYSVVVSEFISGQVWQYGSSPS